jgi:Family of unknown function (DUF6011)
LRHRMKRGGRSDWPSCSKSNSPIANTSNPGATQEISTSSAPPDVQMQTAARLWGHCCICSKELSDPHSLERGIGPDCFRRRVDYITNLAVDGRRLEEITYLSGMPAAFVTELLRESVAQGGSR